MENITHNTTRKGTGEQKVLKSPRWQDGGEQWSVVERILILIAPILRNLIGVTDAF